MKQTNLFVTALALASASCAWAADFQAGDLYYNILDADARTVEVTKPTSGSYAISSVNIPSEVSDGTTTYSVVAVGAEAFRLNTSVMNVVIPEGVKRIEKKAFYNCTYIMSLSLPDGLEYIGGGAFEGCKALSELTIPGTLNDWGYDYGNYARTFVDCSSLKKIVVEEGVTALPNAAFSMLGTNWSAITYLELPSTLTTADGAFLKNIPISMGGQIILHSTTPVSLGEIYTHSWDYDSGFENVEVRVPAEALEAYKADEFWGKFKRLYAIGAEAPDVPAPYMNAIGVPSDYTVSFSARWNDEVAMDNLTELVYIDGPTTVSGVRAIVLKEDDRFYAMKHLENGTFEAYAFDTNGDHSRAIYVDGVAQFMSAAYGYSPVFEKDLPKALPASEYDHWQVNYQYIKVEETEGAVPAEPKENREWKFFVNGELATEDTPVNPGDAIILEYCPVDATAPSEAPYTFYLRPADQQGVWTLDECVINTADGTMAYFPMIANLCDDTQYLYGAGIAGEVYDLDGNLLSSAPYSAYVANGAKGGMTYRLSVSSPVQALTRPYLNIRKDWGDGKMTVKRVYGDSYSKVSTIVAHPLENITLEGIEPDGVIEIDNMGTFILKPVYEPANADFAGYAVTFADEQVATLYASVNAVVAHAAGETAMTLTDKNGKVYGTYTVRVKDVDPNDRPESFEDGLVFLNEEWFTHTSGSLNYIDTDGKVYYRAYGNQNGNMAFGATSCSGICYAGKYVIMSKQAWDNGDTRPLKSGGRVVVFDASTFKHIGAIDEIGGDGRSCVGVTPSKVYLGTTKGIRVMNLDDITIADADIAGITLSRSGQIGDMIKAGKYVFAANIGTGLEIIDTETDQVVKSIPAAKIQSVTQSKDGRVWIGCTNTLTPIDPTTLEVGQEYSIPGSIGCSSGSWRPGNLMTSTKENVLLWGVANSNGNAGTLYRWNLDEVEDPLTLTPVYTHVSTVDGVTYGGGYGAPIYDDRTDTYVFATVPGFGAAALQNWYHFIDATTGEVKHRIHLPEYWWFPGTPILPDKHAAEIALSDFELNINRDPYTVDLTDYVTDADNHDCNITLSLAEAPAAYADEVSPVKAAEITLDGKTLTAAPLAAGTHTFTLVAESNGRVTSKDITVSVKDPSGVTSAEIAADVTYTVYDAAGIRVASFKGQAASEAESLGLTPGIYLVAGSDNSTSKVIIR